MIADDPASADALASLYDAGALQVPPWMALTAALASVRPVGLGATIDWLVAHRAELERAYADGGAAPLAVAAVPAAMQYQPELGYLDRARNDHALRDRYLFADLVGQKSFSQAAIYAITGKELGPRHCELLDAFATANLLLDRRAWPMAVTRRVAARGGGVGAAAMAGVAMMGSEVVAGAAAADCARFLERCQAATAAGRTVAAVVAEALARREKVRGFGRPVVGPDERVPIIEELLRRHGRADLPFVTLLRAADDAFAAAKGLRSTAAAWAAAILLDFGLTPAQVHAVSNHWVMASVFAQATYADERGVREPGAVAAVAAPARPPARVHGGGGEMSKCATNQRLMSTVSEK